MFKLSSSKATLVNLTFSLFSSKRAIKAKKVFVNRLLISWVRKHTYCEIHNRIISDIKICKNTYQIYIHKLYNVTEPKTSVSSIANMYLVSPHIRGCEFQLPLVRPSKVNSLWYYYTVCMCLAKIKVLGVMLLQIFVFLG